MAAQNRPETLSRRELLAGTAALAAGSLGAAHSAGAAEQSEKQAVRKNNIQQSLVYWCYNRMGDKWNIDQMCSAAKTLGVPSIELVSPKHWGTLQKHGLVCAIASNSNPGGFRKAFNNPKYHEEVIYHTKKTIDDCQQGKVPSVIAFTGFQYRDVDDPRLGSFTLEEGAANCVKAFKQVVGYAEKHGVTICLEHLNTRDDSHPMKGHPGYQGDDVEYVVDIIKRVDSPSLKLLFDIYHVQIMNGDLIRRLEQHKDVLGHIHTAGNPGRGELDENQEISYPAVMRKLMEIGYKGYVGQEFIPTRDAMSGLKQAVQLCDV